MNTTTAGSEPLVSRRLQGHTIRGPRDAVAAFARLDAGTQAQYVRETQHYGVTRVVLGDTAWELARHPDHSLEIRTSSSHPVI